MNFDEYKVAYVPNLTKNESKEDRNLCILPGCFRKRHGHGYCCMHYRRMWNNNRPMEPLPKLCGVAKCVVAGCENKYWAKGFCNTHYKSLRYHEEISVRLFKKKPVYINCKACGKRVVRSGNCQVYCKGKECYSKRDAAYYQRKKARKALK